MTFTPNPAEFNTRFRAIGAQWEVFELPFAASVEIGQGAAVYWKEDGEVTKVTGSSNNFAGILAEQITSDDDDYATAKKRKKVLVPLSVAARAEFEVGAGTFTAADVGKGVTFEDEVSVDVDTAGTQLRIVKYIDEDRGECTFNQEITSTL